jgi:hypothetical protein
MGAKGTQIFGENAYAQDPATTVLAVMRNLPGKTPTIAAVRSDIEGVPREQVEGALGAVQASHRAGNGSADSYKNFVWNLKRGEGRPRPARRDGSRILSGLERMRD